MPKKKSVKKKSMKKTEEKLSRKDSCNNEKCRCECNIGLVKFSSMAFILFLITVWPAAGESLMKVHWGWYLGLTIIFGIGAAKSMHHCWCKKKK